MIVIVMVIVSVGFFFYLTGLASYGSVFGSLASVIVAIAYLYISTTAFLFGAQLDAIIRSLDRNTVRRRTRPVAHLPRTHQRTAPGQCHRRPPIIPSSR